LKQQRQRGSRPYLRLQLLGPLRLSEQSSGREISIKNTKTRALLALLASERGRIFPQEDIIEHLWPQEPEQRRSPDQLKKDLANLRNRVAELRRILRTSGVEVAKTLRTCTSSAPGPGGYCLERSPLLQVDIEEFSQLYTQGISAARMGFTQMAITCLEEAVALYGGDFLAEEFYSEWALEARRMWQERYLDCLNELASAYANLRQWTEAIDYCRQVLRIKPYHEGAWHQLIHALAGSGRRAEAIVAYQDYRQTIQRTLGIDASIQIEAFKIIQSGSHWKAAPHMVENPTRQSLNAAIFQSEEQCYHLLRCIRWVHGIYCPHCGRDQVRVHGSVGQIPERRYLCKHCRRTFSDRTGTVFEGSKLPLRKWFYALLILKEVETRGWSAVSAHSLSQMLKTKPATAARMLRRLRSSATHDSVVEKLKTTLWRSTAPSSWTLTLEKS